jgi:hypothetical protein
MLKMAKILLALTTLVFAQGIYAQNDTVDRTHDFGVIEYDNNYFHDIYGFHYGFAMAIGLDDFSTDTTKHLGAVHLDSYLGWRFNKKFSIISGLGFEFNESRISGFRFDTQFLTLHLGGRYNVLNTKYMPYIYGRIGCGFGPPQEEALVDHGNGVNYQAGVGLTLPAQNSSKYSIALAWHHQQANGAESFIDPLGNEINTKYDILINRLIIKFGMEIR